MSSVFATIRERCALVSERARFVRIDDAGLSRLAAELAAEPWPTEDLDPLHHFEGDDETMLAFVLLLDAINFGSGWFPVLKKPPGLSGYRTVASACKRFFEAEGAPRPDQLRGVDAAIMARLLDQNVNEPEVAELMSLFAQAWRDFGNWLGDRHEDCYASVVTTASGSAARLVESLSEMPLYRDVAQYQELEVPLYKRAQITVADLYLAFPEKDWGHFTDLSDLTLFADNLVPHVLRCRGVLEYDATLLATIDRGEPLEVGSLEEVEIRAVAVHAVERLVTEIDEQGRATSARALDGLLWNAGQAASIKAQKRHRARCSFY